VSAALGQTLGVDGRPSDKRRQTGPAGDYHQGRDSPMAGQLGRRQRPWGCAPPATKSLFSSRDLAAQIFMVERGLDNAASIEFYTWADSALLFAQPSHAATRLCRFRLAPRGPSSPCPRLFRAGGELSSLCLSQGRFRTLILLLLRLLILKTHILSFQTALGVPIGTGGAG
jgi:hypothetical protein